MNEHPVILFDGICNFCNSSVQFVLKRDKKKVFLFTPLQSEPGKKHMEQYGMPENELSSFVLIEKGKLFTRSTAALRVCRYLAGGWPLCYGFIIIPPFIRDGVYNWIARNRYKWFGVRQECMIPSPETRARFLS